MHSLTHLFHVITVIYVFFPINVDGNNVTYPTSEQWKREAIENAGCPFIEVEQMLVQDVCLWPNYQSNELPVSGDNRKVTIDLQELTVLEINEDSNEVRFQIKQYLTWCEPRMSANFTNILSTNIPYIKLTSQNVDKLWYPDLDIRTDGLLEWASLYTPDLFKEIVISPKNTKRNCEDATAVLAWKEWKATIYCKFDFSSFPFDTHVCTFLQELDQTSLAILMLKYEEDSLMLTDEVLGFSTNISLIGECGENATDGVGFDITLTRIVSPYIFQYYLPSIACVLTTQVSFMIPLRSIPGRVSLIVIVLLALINILIDLFSNNAAGKSMNALGLYILVSLFFEILVLFELGLVLMLQRTNRDGRNGNQVGNIERAEWLHGDYINNPIYKNSKKMVENHNCRGILSNTQGSRFSITDKIDLGCCSLIMVCFLVFNLYYWSKYLTV